MQVDQPQPAPAGAPVLVLPTAPPAIPASVTPVIKQDKPAFAHLLYAVEMLCFAVIGWAWLAVRELMGDTPVLDVAVLLSLLVSSIVNLLLALTYYTTDQFKGPAQAFLNHVACVWFLYAYGLAQSTTDGRGSICCVEEGAQVEGAQTSQYSLRLTYKAAYFGGLSLHQPPAAITLSFLTIFLILAAAQARVCTDSPREWPMGKAPLAVVCVLGVMQAMFGIKAPVCRDKDISSVVLAWVGIAWFFMLDMPSIYDYFIGFEIEVGDKKKVETRTFRGMPLPPFVRLVQTILEFVFTVLIGVLASVLAVNLGSGDALLLVSGIALFWQGREGLLCILELAYPPEQKKQIATGAPFFSPSSHLSLPGMHELRRGRDKKAW